MIFLSSCGGNYETGKGKFQIVCTTGMIADAAKNIVGDKAEVIALMGSGVDPHLYKASQGDVSKLVKADLILYNGVHLEGKMAEMLHKIGRKKPVFALGDGIDKTDLRKLSGETYDPHIWFSIKLWKLATEEAYKAIIKTDSSNSKYYNQNKIKYIHQLDSLENWVKTAINSIPEKQRILITAHDAFGYFGDEYQVKVKGLQGISTVSEFGLKDVTNLVNYIISNNIKAVFVESSVSPKAIEAVIAGCKSKNHDLKIGGSLYSDAMGEKNSPEGNYIGMYTYNVKQIVNALK